MIADEDHVGVEFLQIVVEHLQRHPEAIFYPGEDHNHPIGGVFSSGQQQFVRTIERAGLGRVGGLKRIEDAAPPQLAGSHGQRSGFRLRCRV